jgi:hypothetical protein
MMRKVATGSRRRKRFKEKCKRPAAGVVQAAERRKKSVFG